jgi:hypothetical protein
MGASPRFAANQPRIAVDKMPTATAIQRLRYRTIMNLWCSSVDTATVTRISGDARASGCATAVNPRYSWPSCIQDVSGTDS